MYPNVVYQFKHHYSGPYPMNPLGGPFAQWRCKSGPILRQMRTEIQNSLDQDADYDDDDDTVTQSRQFEVMDVEAVDLAQLGTLNSTEGPHAPQWNCWIWQLRCTNCQLASLCDPAEHSGWFICHLSPDQDAESFCKATPCNSTESHRLQTQRSDCRCLGIALGCKAFEVLFVGLVWHNSRSSQPKAWSLIKLSSAGYVKKQQILITRGLDSHVMFQPLALQDWSLKLTV